MSDIQPYNAIRSIERSLTEPGQLVDGRSEKDWMHFIAQFAGLVNFYDQHNRPLGNWEPFVLKDPVFLLASISKTNVGHLYTSYKNTGLHVDRLLQRDATSPAVGESFNRLFDSMVKAFLVIRRWVYYMQLSGDEYALKNYTVQQVKMVFSKYFQAIISLRQNLYLTTYIPGVTPVDHDELYLFDAVDGMIWKEHRDKTPYWDVLGLKYPLKDNTAAEINTALNKAGSELFKFMNRVVQQASVEYEQVYHKSCRFPDTLLLRTFINVMQLHRQQMNSLTGKHLSFCYRDILKLSERPVEPDTVFLAATTATGDEVITIPQGTLFDAGVDLQKNPVSFITTEEVEVNPAIISNVYTVAAIKGTDSRFCIYRDQIATPNKVQKTEDGQIKTWKTFGGTISPTSVKMEQAISFASPLLLLREGIRHITITLGFTTGFDEAWLQDVQYFLSTQTAWLPVTAAVVTAQTGEAVISISLDAAQPPIEAFLKTITPNDPDGLPTTWPLFKMEFGSFSDPAQPPVLTTLKISVTVQGVKNIMAYNDFGALDIKAPFQLFGPTPLQHSNFIVGSNEVFSKPLDMLQLEMTFDKLPPDFADYYKEYNLFIQSKVKPPPPENKSLIKKIWSGITGAVSKAWQAVKGIFKKKEPTAEEKKCPYYHNRSFGVAVRMLPNQMTEQPSMEKAVTTGMQDGQLIWEPYPDDVTCGCSTDPDPAVPASQLFFTTDRENCLTVPTSYFVYDKSKQTLHNFIPDPSIQQSPLKYNGLGSSGFIAMTVTGPGNGFGSNIYGDVVSWIAFQNAYLLFNSQPKEDFFGFKEKPEKPAFIDAAKVPFAPKLAAVNINYSATQEYKFNATEGQYPIQCYLYTPIRNFKMFDSNDPVINTSIAPGQNSSGAGISMFLPLSNAGNMFIELDRVIPSTELRFYFELARAFQQGVDTTHPELYYLSNTGWKELPILSDGTLNLNCSGILKVNIPADISNAGAMMPGNKYWVAITQNKDAVSAAATAFLQTNGFSAKRVLDETLTYTTAPLLAANVITQARVALPLLQTIIQPFPSFGGKATETERMMLLRGADRMKTKDRAVTPGDYYRLVYREFPGIFYSKTVYNRTDGIKIFLVRSVASDQEANAFEPLVDECTVAGVQKFLAQRVSGAQPVTASNFNLQTVQVNATVILKTGFAFSGVQKNITRAIKLFCAPWIQDGGPHTEIDQPLTDALLIPVIRNVKGVADVTKITFTTWKYEDGINGTPANTSETSSVQPFDESCLMIPATEHNITQQQWP